MANLWCVRADGGKYTQHFLDGGYIGIDWRAVSDLSHVQSRDDVTEKLRKAYPQIASPYKFGNFVGQISLFLLDIKPGDYVITPPINTEWLRYGQIANGAPYYYSDGSDGCPYPHRRRVDWAEQQVRRSDFSVPFQRTMRALKSVFAVSQHEEFLAKIGVQAAVPKPKTPSNDPFRIVIDQILELDPGEFEDLVKTLLEALGFEEAEVTGKPGDGGVDVRGELDVSNLAKVKLFVQAKRYKIGHNVSVRDVRQFRSAIPKDGQGAFITTSDYPASAKDVALDPNFPRISLINGRQLVDLLIDRWEYIPEEFRDKLMLKRGLVRQ